MFEGRIFKLDMKESTINPVITEVTRGVATPGAVAFDKKGKLYATDFLSGNLYQIDDGNNSNAEDVSSNAQIVAKLPSQLEALAFDKKNRIYVTSFFSGTLYEALGGTDYRIVAD